MALAHTAYRRTALQDWYHKLHAQIDDWISAWATKPRNILGPGC
jgi:hypothetical protein